MVGDSRLLAAHAQDPEYPGCKRRLLDLGSGNIQFNLKDNCRKHKPFLACLSFRLWLHASIPEQGRTTPVQGPSLVQFQSACRILRRAERASRTRTSTNSCFQAPAEGRLGCRPPFPDVLTVNTGKVQGDQITVDFSPRGGPSKVAGS